MRKQLGLTLLEALTVVIIIAVLIIIAVPSFITHVRERRLIMTADNVYSLVVLARSEAIKQNATIYVSVQTGSSWCVGVNSGSACTCATPSSCNLGTISAPNTQLSLSTTAITGNNFQFESTRGASNVSNGKITFDNGTATITVLIKSLGNVSLCSSVSGYQTCP